MIDTATRRTWLGDTQPTAIEPDDEWLTDVHWPAATDTAIARLRAHDPAVDALFQTAERDGLAIIPVWADEHSGPHPLTELASSVTDTDWIMVSAKDRFRPSTAAEMIVDPLAPSSYTRHRTPTWTIYITAH
jgi:hypothetical protein